MLKTGPKGLNSGMSGPANKAMGMLGVYASREQAKGEGTERVYQQLQLRLNAYNSPLTTHRERDWPSFESENERVWTYSIRNSYHDETLVVKVEQFQLVKEEK